ncbi:peroxiredoxin [Pollutimonas thiosulfatoxidans]|uniref:thioredoxin-dependent peroxiredoxin n=1 Tax=Pollutimonas thiosulfatoxidans TaxID=2028345 RepID=A0A410GBU8_9BURK|nr:peroxiredoxin [Pollutimonas thiosulfatoxidans]MBF6615167.1 peroxiredoxin [Candidimonas sp.]NYT44725.1 peroxiredoxin [Alcaligenaceae bacterium]QAA93761.1 peroxiredoxin [Pollutimonas thiosulfatoxidans]
MTQIAVGRAVPEFSAQSTQGQVTLAGLRNHAAVLYFYPKDNTPGCTTQAQEFRDAYQDFVDAGCHIIGVSRDTLKSHEGFTEKQQLPFPLISDDSEALCSLFGVIKMKNMYGKQVRGIERSTFLIGPDGVLLREWRGVRVAGHVDEVLQAVRNI